MDSSRRIASIAGTILFLGLLVLGATWLQNEQVPPHGVIHDPTAREPQTRQAEVVPTRESERSRLGPGELGMLQICDSTDRKPLHEGVLIPALEVARPTVATGDGGADILCDGNGCVAVASLAHSAHWLVRVPGYVSCIVEHPKAGQVVCLDKASPIRVQVLGEDANPVKDVTLALQPIMATSTLGSPVNTKVGVGDPRSASPVWFGRTDGRGICIFDSLPRGSYRLRTAHPFSYAETPAGSGREPVFAPGPVFIEMRDLYAVCVAAPPGRAVLKYSWRLPLDREFSIALQMGRDRALRHLAEAFPDALVYVGRPRKPGSHSPALVGCSAILDGNVAAEVEWPLTKVRDIETPVFLAPNEEKIVRAVIFHVRDKTGTSLPMMLSVVKAGERGAHWARTGEPILLEEGRYKAEPVNAARWVAAEFEQALVEVRKGDPMTIEKTILLHGDYRLVLLEPKWGDARFEGFIHVLLKSAAGRYGVVNWTPARGPIGCLFPAGPGSFRVQGGAYQDISRSFVIDKGEGPVRIEIPLARVNSAPSTPVKNK